MHQQIFSDATSTLHSHKVLATHTMVTPWGNKRVAWKTNIKTWTGHLVKESIRMTEDTDKWRKCVSLAYDTGLPRPLYESSFWTWREVYETYDNHVRRRVVSNVTLNRRHSVSDSRQNVSAWFRAQKCGLDFDIEATATAWSVGPEVNISVSISRVWSRTQSMSLRPFAGIYIMLYSRSSSDLSITMLFSVSENPKVPVPLGGIGTPTNAVSKTLVGRFGVWSRWVKCNLNRRHSILRVKSMPSVKSIGQPIDCSFFGGRSYYSGQSYTRLQYHKQSSCYDNDTSEARCLPIVTAIPEYHGSSELPAGIRFSKIASSTCMKQPVTI